MMWCVWSNEMNGLRHVIMENTSLELAWDSKKNLGVTKKNLQIIHKRTPSTNADKLRSEMVKTRKYTL